jgi:hypothetical protein
MSNLTSNPWIWLVAVVGFLMVMKKDEKVHAPKKKRNPGRLFHDAKMREYSELAGRATDPELKKYYKYIAAREEYNAGMSQNNPALPFDSQFGKRQISIINPVGSCDPRLTNPTTTGHYNGFFIPDKNSKLGSIWNFALPRGRPNDTGGNGTCVNASPWCSAACYGKGGQYMMHAVSEGDPSLTSWYGENLKLSKASDFSERMIATLGILEKKNHPRVMRLHPVGDFYSIKYIKDWIAIAKAKLADKSGWKFYTYTRTWQRSSFLPYLNELRHLDNFNLLASTDASLPPNASIKGWQQCGVDVSYDRSGVPCMHDVNGTLCLNCGICYRKGSPSLFIKAHSLTEVGKKANAFWVAKRKAKYGFNPR